MRLEDRIAALSPRERRSLPRLEGFDDITRDVVVSGAERRDAAERIAAEAKKRRAMVLWPRIAARAAARRQ